MLDPDEVTDFWLNEVGSNGWYLVDDALDDKIRNRFQTAWETARDGGFSDWRLQAETLLPYLILTDQFPRNMFRDSGKAFATDEIARCVAKKAIDKKWDMRVPEPERQFFYLPLMHSESLADQERCICLIKTRMPDTGESNLLHAKAHREVIRRFGRFPYRNVALGRQDTALEVEFIEQGGYSVALQVVQD
ncbi:MAG: DUF924 domain-containing protein [Marinosulfonomonas sp.]|nr:DUF924 domain-containing protein [Marinosulfonomonas sp.]